MDPIEQSCDIIRKKLETCAWQPGERLPSLLEMASLCGVSRTTMWRALQVLKKESFVHTVTRGAIYAGPAGTARLATATLQGKVAWERLKDRIGRDIISGTFADSNLPSTNKLALLYGVSIPTLKKALGQLTDKGMLATHGRRYVIPPRHARFFTTHFVLISTGQAGGELTSIDDRTRSIIESIERECIKRQCGRAYVGFNDHEPDSILAVRRRLKQIQASGFIVNFWNPGDKDHLERWCDLFRYLTGLKLPVIVIDQSVSFIVPDDLSSHAHFRVLRIAGVRAGEMVADAILRRGHRRVAYITPSPEGSWVQDRYAGLCAHVRQFGGSGARVEMFTFPGAVSEEPGLIPGLVLKLLDLDKEDIRSLFRHQSSAEGMDNLMKYFNHTGENPFLSISATDAKVMTIRSEARHLSKLAREPHDPEIFRNLFDGMYDRASTYAYNVYLRPLLENALAHSDATAWVCSDDKPALSALAFLSSCGKKKAEHIMVVGFNNWLEDQVVGLSSYEFNMDGIVRLALTMIVDEKLFRSKPRVSEVDGYVVERRTTRR